MQRPGRHHASRSAIAGALLAAAAAVAVPSAPAAAEGFLQFLFGGFRRPPPQPPVQNNSPDDLFRSLFERDRRQSDEAVRSASGPHSGYCVRLCDGRYFPIQARRNVSAAQQCSSFCPASETRIFAGGGIEQSVAGDGKRYVDLPNAFAYRKQLVPGCTCNGRDGGGLAGVPIDEDPTLRPGDIVATDRGFTVYNGRDPQREAAFTPLDSAKVSKSVRSQLADVKITQQPQPVETGSIPAAPEHTATVPARTSSVANELRRVSDRDP